VNPLSAIFAAGVSARNALYDRRILATRKLTRPVVSIGNLSVGGSGKTPFVIALGELLKERGITFDVLSRGYGRSGQKIEVVDPQGTSEQFGDEPLLIARKLQVPVIVAADRYQAGLLAEEKFPSKLHLLDDAFQHRRLHRDFDIVMLPAADLEDTLLPVGRLREPLSSLRRADAVVLTSTGQDISPWNPEAAIWHARRETFLDPAPFKALAFCGIARPHVFFDELRILRADLSETVAFPDHHRYSQNDVQRLLARKAASGAQGFILTEKDEINLGPLAAQLQPLQVARLRLVLEDPQKDMKALLHTLTQRSGCGL
jgi:tetraacyldisaccharide 4'-kinase